MHAQVSTGRRVDWGRGAVPNLTMQMNTWRDRLVQIEQAHVAERRT